MYNTYCTCMYLYYTCAGNGAESMWGLQKDGRHSSKNIIVDENLVEVSFLLVGENDARRKRTILHGKLQSAQLKVSQIATEVSRP